MRSESTGGSSVRIWVRFVDTLGHRLCMMHVTTVEADSKHAVRVIQDSIPRYYNSRNTPFHLFLNFQYYRTTTNDG